MTDVGKSLFCRVTATNAAGSASADSNTVGPVTAAGGGAATTFDPAHTAAEITLSPGNLTATLGDNLRAGTRSIATGSDKKYFELLLTTIGSAAATVVGIANSTLALDQFPGSDLDGIGLAFDGSVYLNNVTLGNMLLSIASGDIICVAVDFTAEKIWFRHNAGTWNGGLARDPVVELHSDPTDPLTGFNFASLNAGPYYVFLSLRSPSDVCTANFGATAYTHTPPAGYGNF